jgi:hypothetical protein
MEVREVEGDRERGKEIGGREEMGGWDGGTGWKGQVGRSGRVGRFGLRGEWARKRESGGGGGLGGIGRVEEALGRGKRRYLKRRGMATADGVSREPTVWGRAPPQGLRGIAAGEEVG